MSSQLYDRLVELNFELASHTNKRLKEYENFAERIGKVNSPHIILELSSFLFELNYFDKFLFSVSWGRLCFMISLSLHVYNVSGDPRQVWPS